MQAVSLAAVVCMILASYPLILADANEEVDALYALSQGLSDPYQVLHNWDNSLVNPTTWWHVVCNDDTSVKQVNLGWMGLSGELVGDLGKLTRLEHLLLNDNNITGEIPSELGGLTSLIDLDLTSNNHSGSIPDSLANLKSLKYLQLSNNKLTGGIPDLSGLNELLVLNLSNNKLSGKVPSGLYKLPKLRYLDLTQNPDLTNVKCGNTPCYFSSVGE